MSGPVNVAGRVTLPLDDLMRAGGRTGWEALEAGFAPAPVADRFRPEERIMRFAAALGLHPEGREFLEWIFDLTCRAPYPKTTGDMQELAYAAAKHQARAAVGDVIALAIAEGRRLNDTPVATKPGAR